MRKHIADPQALLSLRMLLINVQILRSQDLHCHLKRDFHNCEEHRENYSSKIKLTRNLSCVHGQPTIKAQRKCCPRVVEGALSSRHTVLLMSSIIVCTQYSGYNRKIGICDSLRRLHGCQSLSVHPVTHLPSRVGSSCSRKTVEKAERFSQEIIVIQHLNNFAW